jgi:hypothetical protein
VEVTVSGGPGAVQTQRKAWPPVAMLDGQQRQEVVKLWRSGCNPDRGPADRPTSLPVGELTGYGCLMTYFLPGHHWLFLCAALL